MADYTTLAELKAAFSEKSIQSTGDTNLSRLITAASRTIDNAVSIQRPRTFAASGDTTQTFNVLDRVIGNVLYLHTDVCAVTTVTNDGTPVSAPAYKLLSEPPHTSTYNRIKLLTGSWAYSVSVYPDAAASVTGRFAFSTTPPPAIVQATIQLCLAVWLQRNTVANISQAMISADGTLVLPDGLPASVVALIEPYIT